MPISLVGVNGLRAHDSTRSGKISRRQRREHRFSVREHRLLVRVTSANMLWTIGINQIAFDTDPPPICSFSFVTTEDQTTASHSTTGILTVLEGLTKDLSTGLVYTAKVEVVEVEREKGQADTRSLFGATCGPPR